MAEPNLEERVTALERQLRGEPDQDQIDLRALPMAPLQRSLENNWRPEGLNLLQQKSVTADEIGELPGARSFLHAPSAVINNVWTPISFPNPMDYDITGMFVQAVRYPGKYLVVFNAVWDISGAGTIRIARITRGRAGVARAIGHQEGQPHPGNFTYLCVVALAHFAEGDVILPEVYQNSGGNLNLLDVNGGDATDGNMTSIAIQWVGS